MSEQATVTCHHCGNGHYTERQVRTCCNCGAHYAEAPVPMQAMPDGTFQPIDKGVDWEQRQWDLTQALLLNALQVVGTNYDARLRLAHVRHAIVLAKDTIDEYKAVKV